MKNSGENPIICVVGLGFVGLPVAEAFSKHFRVIGFDIDSKRVRELRLRQNNQNLSIVDKPQLMRQADFIIITVPTPVTKSKQPDLSCITMAAKIISNNMKVGCTVILESTVYPGVTEDIVKPILEESGLKCGKDFQLAYCPERVNPGDTDHTLDKITKVVSGIDECVTESVARLYNKICPTIFKAKNIRTAEAAKLIENVQRDLNIALINELSLIFERISLDTKDVLEAANTKWNFHKYSPGLVGGHCIPVDPYYLVHKAEEVAYHPQVILAGRAINDYMPKHIVYMAIKALNNVNKKIRGSRVLIIGLTYKENVPDIRETPVRSLIKELEGYGVMVIGFDPLLDDIEGKFGIKAITRLDQVRSVDCLILAIVHSSFKDFTLDKIRPIMNDRPILIDVRGFFNREEAVNKGFHYCTL